MIQSVKKWGNSPAIRLPLSIMVAAQLELDQTVDIRAENGRIIIEPVTRHYDLEMLLSGITSENLHREVGFGTAQGQELL